MRVQPLRSTAIKTLDKQSVGLTEIGEISPFFFDEGDEGKNNQALTSPVEKTSKHENFVHQRFSDTRRSRIHETLPL